MNENYMQKNSTELPESWAGEDSITWACKILII